MGYPTQKPIALLRRIIQASSNPGDTILDPYCGCGTTIAACKELEKDGEPRQFIGMDLEGFAAQVMRKRMRDKYGEDLDLGYSKPKSLSDFDQLAENKAWLYYEHYAVELIPGAMPATSEVKSALGLPTGGSGDKGMDGLLPVIYRGKQKYLVISVKAGKGIPANAVRDLCGVVANNADVIGGVLVTRRGEMTSEMWAEVSRAGYLPAEKDENGNEWQFPRIRHLSVKQLWDAWEKHGGRAAGPGKPSRKTDLRAWANRLELPFSLLSKLVADFNDPKIRKQDQMM